MKLAACILSWDDFDMLKVCINNIRPCVDIVIVAFSKKSNFGEVAEGLDGSAYDFEEMDTPVYFFQIEPDSKMPPSENETNKRNFALKKAMEFRCTHFICMDSDEFYHRDEFNAEKEKFKYNHNLAGMVCRIQTYFGSPELTIGDEGTLVPFIHRITPGLKHEFNRRYPFAWSGGIRNRRLHIDPTRSLNIYQGVEMSEITMHHYSWIRKDFQKKIRNSTARGNLEKSTIMQDLMSAKEGYFVNFYGRELRRAPNYFGIPNYGVEIQTTDAGK